MNQLICLYISNGWTTRRHPDNYRAQNEIYRLQSRCDTAEADRSRLEVEAERSGLVANKAKEDLRKLQEESTRYAHDPQFKP